MIHGKRIVNIWLPASKALNYAQLINHGLIQKFVHTYKVLIEILILRESFVPIWPQKNLFYENMAKPPTSFPYFFKSVKFRLAPLCKIFTLSIIYFLIWMLFWARDPTWRNSWYQQIQWIWYHSKRVPIEVDESNPKLISS